MLCTFEMLKSINNFSLVSSYQRLSLVVIAVAVTAVLNFILKFISDVKRSKVNGMEGRN